MTAITDIPLNKLIAWDGNVRKTGPEKGIDELAASIAAHGLLQSLVVRKHTRGKFAVVAGRRRLRALKSLAETKGTEAAADSEPVIVLAASAGQPDGLSLSPQQHAKPSPNGANSRIFLDPTPGSFLRQPGQRHSGGTTPGAGSLHLG